MTDTFTDDALRRRLRATDPLAPGSLPSEADTEAALRRLMAAGRSERAAGRLERAAGARAPRLRRPRVLAGTIAGVLAAGLAVALVLGGTAATPAFAVSRNADGTVTVTVMRPSGVAGANRKLSSMGVRARFVSVVAMARYVAKVQPCAGKSAGELGTITFDPRTIPSRHVLLVAVDRSAKIHSFSAAMAKGGPAAADPAMRRAVAQARKLGGSSKHVTHVNQNAAVKVRFPGERSAGKPGGSSQAQVVRVYCGRAAGAAAAAG